MKTCYFKIRDHFIDQIKLGNKKHEYRLASPERMQIKIGDTLVLISNQDKRNYIKVTIKAKKVYNGWKEALEENWEQDFKALYSTIDEALVECYKFYDKKEVDSYGIVVFEIEPIITDYKNANVLLDTNIIIKRESNHVSYEVSKLFSWFTRKKITTFIHPKTIFEISKYEDKGIRETISTKMNAYSVLPEFFHEKNQHFDKIISKYPNDENGAVDNILLREVYDDNIDILLTDDKLILRKAEELYIRERVFTSSQLLSYFENLYSQNIEYKMLAVKLKNLEDVDLESSFFDSLREDYGGNEFDKWFKKKVRNNDKAYVFEDNSGLKGFLYLKIEDEKESYMDISPAFAPKRRLKVGTFKIESTGFRLGERFLKIIFDNALEQNVDEIYVTLFEDKREDVKKLKKLMEEWGFKKHGYKTNGEAVLCKTMREYEKGKPPKFNFPLNKENANCFFLPINPEYHTDLFPDNILNNEDMHLYEENKAHRYALEKIYISGAYNIKAKPGDLVLIYRAGERIPKKSSSCCTGVAIVEEIIPTKTVDECIKLCKNRSIFDEEEIRKLYPKYSKVIKLLDYKTFKNKVNLDQLYKFDIVKKGSGPRPFDTIGKEQFEKVINIAFED